MSQILKELLKPEILSALKKFGSTEYKGPDEADKAQEKFAEEIALAIATATQKYLTQHVLTNPAKGPVTGPGFGPVGHVHPQLPQGITAP